MRTLILAAAFLLVSANESTAQVPELPAEPLPQMDALQFLVGDWAGEGWIQQGPDRRFRFLQTERIRSRIGGDAILIEGRGVSPADTSVVVHDALAIISWDTAGGQYVMKTFLRGGRTADPDVEVGDETLIWTIGTNVRYTITLDEQGRWFEIGEYSRDDGASWNQFFEMTLERVTDG